MPSQISLSTESFAPAPLLTGGTTEITAHVTDCAGKPLEDVKVKFKINTPRARLSAASGVTDALGNTTVTLSYPAASGASKGGVIPVTAEIAGCSKTLLINFYDPNLRPVKILNTQYDDITGITKLGSVAITFGVQALVFFPDTLADGDRITFYWGGHIARKKYSKGEHVWVVEPGKLFDAAEALKQGPLIVWYSIEDAAGNIAGAQPVSTLITNSPDPVLMT